MTRSLSRSGRFAAVLSTMHAAHNLADHVLQTDHQAAFKATSWRAMAGHVGSYHATQAAALAAADRALGLRLSPARVAVAVAWSAGTHAFLDRRWPVRRALELTGSPGFARGTFSPPDLLVGPIINDASTAEYRIPLHGPYLADQALRHACLWVAALIAVGGRP
jgi:hypothetical protein